LTNPSPSDDINLEQLSQTLLRIVAHLPQNGYSDVKSNGHYRRQIAELELNNLPDPASASDTAQG